MTKIKKLQNLLINKNIKAYIIPTSDFHDSEYISEYFMARKFLSGFTGSAGTLVVTQTEAKLWTDGRYFIQATKELDETEIELMKMGEPNVKTIEQYLESILNNNDTLGFDGRVLNANFVLSLIDSMKPKKINITSDLDLINDIWENRPQLPNTDLMVLNENYSGESFKSKIKRLREKIKAYNADVFVLSALEDQAWLYNLRANDVKYTPVFLSFSIITLKTVYIFINENRVTSELKEYFNKNNIEVFSYQSIYEVARSFSQKTILIDYKKTNYNLYIELNKDNFIINAQNPTLLMKSIKNDVEIENTKKAHIKDGVAVTKFMYHIKNNLSKNETELSAQEYIEHERKKLNGFIENSFSTICAFKDHGAMMHYSANKESNYKIDGNGFLLVDSGGHYYEGTTDITRTFAIGNVTKEMKIHYTTVLASLINLASAVFLKGVTGLNLDILARGPIWKLKLDYKCGTGHGVGHILSVHEGPNGFRWKIVPERNDSAPFEPGMITTDEPGIYLEGKYGIRIENELVTVPYETNENGQFYKFETITLAPIDLDAIDSTILNKEQKDWLNAYHKEVYEKISPYLNDVERIWLKDYTHEI